MFKKNDDMTNYARGVKAENLAVDYLKNYGYEILKTRYKTKFGEIDIIAKHEDCLCFIEVKMRGSERDALESVTPRIKKRIENSALFFLSENAAYNDFGMRFDVIAVTPPFHIRHLDNAWQTRS
jgi:putative endonuclease